MLGQSAVPLFKAGQVGTQRCVFLGDQRQLSLLALELLSGRLQRLFLFRACRFLGFELSPIQLQPLFDGGTVAHNALQLELDAGQPRVNALEFFGQLTALVVQRENIFLFRLLPRAQHLQLLGQRRGLFLNSTSCDCSAFNSACFRRSNSETSRNSRFSASGPAPVFFPPLTAWP